MAGTCQPIMPHVIRPESLFEKSRFSSLVGFPARIPIRKVTSPIRNNREGPSCIFVGPIETASKETLEALYSQARDAYYGGKPLILDDMFDRVELKLRSYGSKTVVKYPRCSLRRQSTYADAEEDLSQVLLLATIWILIFTFGTTACLLPTIYALAQPYQDASDFKFPFAGQLHVLASANGLLFIALGLATGFPIVSAAIRVLQRLWTNDLAGLRGSCPNCGEEVFAFVRSNQSNSSPHRADCHVCECTLEFRTKVEKSTSRLGRQWVYGRIYLVSRPGENHSRRSRSM